MRGGDGWEEQRVWSLQTGIEISARSTVSETSNICTAFPHPESPGLRETEMTQRQTSQNTNGSNACEE